MSDELKKKQKLYIGRPITGFIKQFDLCFTFLLQKPLTA